MPVTLTLSQVLGWQGQMEEDHEFKTRKSGQDWLFSKNKPTERFRPRIFRMEGKQR